jgi:hypothetical protein
VAYWRRAIFEEMREGKVRIMCVGDMASRWEGEVTHGHTESWAAARRVELHFRIVIKSFNFHLTAEATLTSKQRSSSLSQACHVCIMRR